MKRREFILALGGAAATWPLTASAQQAAKISHIGYLAGSLRTDPHLSDAFLERLRELGYVDGQNLAIEYRDADGHLDRLPGLAAELARLELNLIFTGSSIGPRAVRRATSTIPIVCPVIADPVGDGLAVSLARPGGNVTGLTSLYPGLIPKRLEVLKQMVPGILRVAILQEPGILGEATTSILLNETEHAARSLGVQVKFLYARNVDELDDALSKISSEHADALIPFGGTLIYIERKRLVDFAAKYRLPTMFNTKEHVELGGLIAYGANLPDLYRRAADYVDKILKGAKPGDLPIEEPTKFELVINLKTAKTLGLTVPPSLLGRADEVME